MKRVLRHISTCELYANCTFSQCNISKELMKHWEKCNQKECSLCVPIKTEQSRKNNLHTPNDKKSIDSQGTHFNQILNASFDHKIGFNLLWSNNVII